MSETKEGSLISDFVGAIKSGMEKVNKYKTDCNAFKQEVSGYADQLKALIDQLEACIREIEKLQGQYVAFIQQLQIIQENLRIQIRNTASGAKSGADTQCNDRILKIKNEFQGLMGLINGLKLDTETGMKTQLGRLKSTLKKLCDDTDGIVGKMRKGNTGMKTQVDSMNEEFGVATASDVGETKGGKISDPGEDLTDLAQYAYRDENDPNRLKLITDLRADDNGNIMVDNPNYRGINGRNKDWYVNWQEVVGNVRGRPYYYKSDGENFKENGQNVESTYNHPSKIMAGGRRKKRKTRKKRRRKMKGGWQTKSQMNSKNSPIRSLTSVSRNTKKSKSKKSKSKKSKKSRSRNSVKKSKSSKKSRKSIRKTY